MRRLLAFAVVGGLSLLCGPAPSVGDDKKEEGKAAPPVRLTVDLRDGSRLIGQCATVKELALSTGFGGVRVPIERVASIDFKDDKETCVIHFRNGDRLTGALDAGAVGDLKLTTVLGELKVPLNLVAACQVEAPPRRATVTARASGSYDSPNPGDAFADNPRRWNSGGYAPQWVEADLGAPSELVSLQMFPDQDIKGETIHQVWVSNEPIGDNRDKAKLVHTFKGVTDHNQELQFTFPKGTTGRYVEIQTTQSPTWVSWLQIDLRVR
jgi:hypothetical protein